MSLGIPKGWTLFLDRDGVINQRPPGDYVRNPEGFHFLPGVLEAMPALARHFNLVLVVTNQQGIGKGLMTEADLERVHQFMRKAVHSAGGRIDGIYFCPDLKSQVNNCRKPAPALAIQAQLDFPGIYFSKSVMVGDSASDMVFGEQLGMKTALITTKPEDLPLIEQAGIQVDFLYASLKEFAEAHC